MTTAAFAGDTGARLEATRLRLSDGFGFARRVTREVKVGYVGIGGCNPIRVQSMTTTDTLDVEATVAQALRLASVGCEIVRITAPTVEDARNLGRIRDALRAKGCDVPLVADIHFSPAAAIESKFAAQKLANRWVPTICASTQRRR